MRVLCGKLAPFLLLGNSAVVKAQPLSPNASKPIAPLPKPKPAALVPKPVVAPVPKPAAPLPKPKPAATVPKPVAPVPKPAAAPVSAGSGCPTISSYTKPPASECVNCYTDMSALATYLTFASGNVSATVCSGTHPWPATERVINTGDMKSLTLSCCGDAKSCIIDGGSPIESRQAPLFRFLNSVHHLDIQGITFQNINCTDNSFTECTGILAMSSAALVTFKHNKVSNVTSNRFGAIYIWSPSLLFIENCVFIDNTAASSYGGTACLTIHYSRLFINGNSFVRNSAFIFGALSLHKSWAVANCNTFEGIESEEGYYYDNGEEKSSGGAFYLESSSLDAKLNVFINNTAGYGAAIYALNSKIDAMSNTFTLNTARNGGAGAAIYLDSSSLDAESNTFTKNTAGDGAIHALNSNIHAELNRFSFNTASNGGAGAAIHLQFSHLDAKRNVFTNNTAGQGGAIYGLYSVMGINADTFANNSATTGGDNIYVDGRAILTTCPSTLIDVYVEESTALSVVNCF